jgi:FkbM family methyltransferase
MATLYAKAAFVFVENDSRDGTKERLGEWLSAHPCAALLNLDGLAASEQSRTARLARARNSYLDYLKGSPYETYDDLIVLDMDDANVRPLDLAAFAAAAELLHAEDQTVGVFASSLPVYYDIWALRHPKWCPNDCWAEVRGHQGTKAEAIDRYVFSRQIVIQPDEPPIPVASAFGGLGIYRLTKVLAHRYVGTNADGTEVCEHVALNLELSRNGNLFIFPALQNTAPREHLPPIRFPTRQLNLEQSGRSCVLLAPTEHRLDVYRAANPLYDRRLPLLSSLVGAAAPDSTIIDIGANIGDTVALCRMAGCDVPMVAVEPSVRYFTILEANSQSLPQLFKDVRMLRAFIGLEKEQLRLVEHAGTASVEVRAQIANSEAPGDTPTMPLRLVTDQPVSLIKTDTDGYDAVILLDSLPFLRAARPVIWAEAEVFDFSDEQRWRHLCTELAESHPHMCIFDNFGFLVTHGTVAEKVGTFMDLLRYTRLHKASDIKSVGPPTIYYVDVVFFPSEKFDVYTAFVNLLIESSPLSGS